MAFAYLVYTNTSRQVDISLLCCFRTDLLGRTRRNFQHPNRIGSFVETKPMRELDSASGLDSAAARWQWARWLPVVACGGRVLLCRLVLLAALGLCKLVLFVSLWGRQLSLIARRLRLGTRSLCSCSCSLRHTRQLVYRCFRLLLEIYFSSGSLCYE